MASPTVNVLRWSALAFGLVYGIVHHNTLASAAEKRRADEEFQRKSSLITQAKAEWAKKQKPGSTNSSGDVISDPR